MSVMTRARLVVLAMVAVAVSACTNQSSGQPVPGSNTSTSESPGTSSGSSSQPTGSGEVFDSIKPCELLSASELQRLHADPGTSSSDNSCKWSIPGTGAFGVTLRADQSLNDIDAGQGTLSDDSVGSRKAKRLSDAAGPGGCLIAIEVGSRARTDVEAAARTDTAKACDLAGQIAGLIEPRLPKGE
jgi:hypothetical protein